MLILENDPEGTKLGHILADKMRDVFADRVIELPPEKRQAVLVSILIRLIGCIVGLLTIALKKPPSIVSLELLETLKVVLNRKIGELDDDYRRYNENQEQARIVSQPKIVNLSERRK